MTPRQGGHVRIAIGGRCLDEVHIRQIRADMANNALSYLTFPAHRHRASVEPDHVVVSTQAATVVQLFAEGVLVPIGGPAATLEIGGQECGPCVLEAVESEGASPLDTTIVLRFRPAGGPWSSVRSSMSVGPLAPGRQRSSRHCWLRATT